MYLKEEKSKKEEWSGKEIEISAGRNKPGT